MPLFDDAGWIEYLRSFDETEEHDCAEDRLLLAEFFEQIGMQPKDIVVLQMLYQGDGTPEQVAKILKCRVGEVDERYQHAVDDARRRALILINLEYVKEQSYAVRLFLRHLFMW